MHTTGTHHHACGECAFEAAGPDHPSVADHQDATGHTVADDTGRDLDGARTLQLPEEYTTTPARWCVCRGYAPDTDRSDLIHVGLSARTDGPCRHGQFALPLDPASVVLSAVRSAPQAGPTPPGHGTPKLPAAMDARIRDRVLDRPSPYTD